MPTTTSVKSIIEEFESYRAKNGGVYRQWYVGVATNPKKRLFQDHNVSEQLDAWIYAPCENDSAARRVEDHFLRKGCDGGDGGGSASSRYVYLYKKTARTRP